MRNRGGWDPQERRKTDSEGMGKTAPGPQWASGWLWSSEFPALGPRFYAQRLVDCTLRSKCLSGGATSFTYLFICSSEPAPQQPLDPGSVTLVELLLCAAYKRRQSYQKQIISPSPCLEREIWGSTNLMSMDHSQSLIQTQAKQLLLKRTRQSPLTLLESQTSFMSPHPPLQARTLGLSN